MMEIILAKEKEKCCGCGTCMLVCPAKAIRMVPGELGCLYPKIDPEKCIRCHACEKICAYSQTEQAADPSPRFFVAAAKNKAVLKDSASGGVAASLGRSILDAGGIVYGCSLEMEDRILTPKHIGVKTHADIRKLQGSKYVHSDLGAVFSEIKQLLREQKTVLFSGTPCQVDALGHYLKGTDTSKLFTMDLICHGVPSGELFRAYLRFLGKRENGQITAFSFRNKNRGGGLDSSYHAGYTVRKDNGTEKVKDLPANISSYYSFFLGSETYRESCYHCRYANTARVGDITIGDFWGIEKEHPELLAENDKGFLVHEGVSVVLVNTPKGEELLARYGQDMHLTESRLDKAVKWNRQLCGPGKCSDLRKDLGEAWEKARYAGIERLFRRELGIRYPVRRIKHWLKR